ncbi:MAG: hypothetical protein ACFFFG_08135 [Candidatus Thorarchaeota archaeon]
MAELEVDKPYYIYTIDGNVFKGTFKQVVKTEKRAESYHFTNCELYVSGEPRSPTIEDMWFIKHYVKYFTTTLIP